MGIRREFSKDVIVYGIGNGIKKFIGIFLLPIYTRALSPSEYGIIDTLSTSILLLMAFFNLGLDSAASYYYFKASDEREKGKILFTKLVMQSLSFFPAIILAIFAPFFSSLLFQNPNYTSVIIVSSFIIPVNLILSEQSHVMRYLRLAWDYNLMTILKSLANIGLGFLLVVSLDYGIIGAQIASLGSGLVVIIISFSTKTRNFYYYEFSFDLARRMLKFGFPLIWAGIIGWVFSSSDRYFLLLFRDTAEIGLYSVASTLSQPISLLNMAIQMSFGVIFYRIYNEEKDPDKPKAKSGLIDVMVVYILVGVFIASFLSLFAENMMTVLATKAYLAGAAGVPFISFANLFSQAFQISSIGISLSEKTWYFTLIIILVSCISIALNYFLIPEYGFLGAAMTNLAAYFIYWALGYSTSQKFFRVPFPVSKLLFFSFAAFVLSISSRFLVATIGINDILVKTIIYFVILIVPFSLKLVDKQIFMHIFHRFKIDKNK